MKAWLKGGLIGGGIFVGVCIIYFLLWIVLMGSLGSPEATGMFMIYFPSILIKNSCLFFITGAVIGILLSKSEKYIFYSVIGALGAIIILVWAFIQEPSLMPWHNTSLPYSTNFYFLKSYFILPLVLFAYGIFNLFFRNAGISVGLGFLTLILSGFLIGIFIGWFIRKINKKILILIGVILLLFFIISLVLYIIFPVSKCHLSIFRDSCYHDYATTRNDSSVCELISNDRIKSQCFEYIGRRGNPDLCDNIPLRYEINPYTNRTETYFDRNSCYENAAISLNDSSICDKIIDQKLNLKFDCYKEIGIAKLDLSICDKIIDYIDGEGNFHNGTEWKYECYRIIAIRTENLDICKKISLEGKKQGCIQIIEYRLKNKA